MIIFYSFFLFFSYSCSFYSTPAITFFGATKTRNQRLLVSRRTTLSEHSFQTPRCSRAKLSGNCLQLWRIDPVDPAAGVVAGKEAAGEATTATVTAPITGEEGGEVTTAAGGRGTTTAAVDAAEALMPRNSITG